MIYNKLNIMINPTLSELKGRIREDLYEWDEVKATLTEDSLIVWLDDIHHVDLMKSLRIDYNNRYDIVIYLNSNKVVMTHLYDREYNEMDIFVVANNKNIKSLLKTFKVELEYK